MNQNFTNLQTQKISSIDSPKIKSLLIKLYKNATDNDQLLQPQISSLVANEYNGVMNDAKLSLLLDDAFMAVSPEIGRLIYSLVRIHKPKLIVEFGTSMGISAIHIAAAIQDNGFGKLITTELNSKKVKIATDNMKEAGLGEYVEFRQGDAFETLADISDIDLLVLDGWKELYLPLLKQLESKLSKDCLVIADDIDLMPEVLDAYLNYIRNPANGYTSCTIGLDDGLELSIR